ncbi:NXPE family member 3-like [Saccoglossus kowalevskii]
MGNMKKKVIAVALMTSAVINIGFILVYLDVSSYVANYNTIQPVRNLYQHISEDEIIDDVIQYGNNIWNISAAFKGSKHRTNAQTTVVTLSNDAEFIYRGDVIVIKLHARDDNGRDRNVGGDIWRVAINNMDKKFSSMGKITDHNNGTYTVHVYAGLSGQVQVQVTLVLQREAVLYQRDVLRPTELRSTWRGIFKRRKKTEHTYCVLMREGVWDNKCEFPHPKALGMTTFVCDPPKTLHCNTLTEIQNVANIPNSLNRTMAENNYFFQSPNADQVITNSSLKEITIKDRREPDNLLYSIPHCKAELPDTLSDGYWLGSRWHSLVCQSKQWTNVTEVQECLKDKDVYFLGDSTTHQWYKIMINIVGYPVNMTDSNWRRKVSSIPGLFNASGTDAYSIQVTDLKNNINFTFRHHAISRHTRYPIPIQRFPFFVDLIDGLTAPKCNYVIVLSFWAHFEAWTQTSFSERVANLEKGVKRLKKRCPNSIIGIKGSHAKHDVQSYWIVYDMIRIMKETFSGDGVFFIDIWDMNFAYAIANKKDMETHMPLALIREEVYLFLSYVCP